MQPAELEPAFVFRKQRLCGSLYAVTAFTRNTPRVFGGGVAVAGAAGKIREALRDELAKAND